MRAMIAAAAILIGVVAAHALEQEEKTLARIRVANDKWPACEQVGELHLLLAIKAHNDIAVNVNKSWNQLPLPNDCAEIDGGTDVLILDFHKSNDMWDDSFLIHLPLDRYPAGLIPNLWVQAAAIDPATVRKKMMSLDCALYVKEKCK